MISLRFRTFAINLLAILLLILINLTAKAQTVGKNLGGVEVDIYGGFNPEIIESGKISSFPSIKDSTKKIQLGKYSFIDKRVETKFEVEPILAAKMKGLPLVKLYRSYLKGGLGNYKTPLLEAYYSSIRSKDFIYSVDFKHISSSGSLNDTLLNSGFSNNQLGLNGKYFIDKHTIGGGFDYNRNLVHYYGVQSNLKSSITDIRQRFNLFNGRIDLGSNYTDSSKINHTVNLNYFNLSDLFDAKENNFNIAGSVNKYHGKELFGVNFGNDFYTNTNSVDSGYTNIFSVNPEVLSKGEKWQLKAGLSAFIESSNDNVSFANFYPNVVFNYNIIDNILIPYIGINGKTYRNSYLKASKENPFINPTASLQNTQEKINVFGGIRGSLSSAISFNTSLKYSKIDNMAFFVNDSTGLFMNKFNLVYDDVKVLNIYGEAAYQKFEKLKFIAKANYFKYEMNELFYAWHKPTIDFTFSLNYNLRDKIVVKSDIYYQNNRKVLKLFNINGDAIQEQYDPLISGPFIMNLKPFIDLNLGVEYRYTKHLSAFLNLNNIGAVKYSTWYNYPTQRFNLLGGFTYSF